MIGVCSKRASRGKSRVDTVFGIDELSQRALLPRLALNAQNFAATFFDTDTHWISSSHIHRSTPSKQPKNYCSNSELRPNLLVDHFSRIRGLNDVAPEVDYTGEGVDGKQTVRGLEQIGFEADGG